MAWMPPLERSAPTAEVRPANMARVLQQVMFESEETGEQEGLDLSPRDQLQHSMACSTVRVSVRCDQVHEPGGIREAVFGSDGQKVGV